MDKVKDAIVRFTGAKSREHAWVMLLIHINIFGYAYCFWTTQPVLPFLSQNLKADPVLFGYLQTTFNLVQLIGGPLVGRLCDAKGGNVAIVVSNVGGGLNYLLMGLSTSLPLLFLSQIPTLLMHTMHAAQACVTELSSAENRAAALGRLSLSYGLGMVVGSPSGGILSKFIGYQGVSIYAGTVSFFLAAISAFFIPSMRPNKQSESTVPSQRKLKKKQSDADINLPEAEASNAPLGTFNLSNIITLIKLPSVRQLLVLQFFVGMVLSVQRSSFSQALRQQFALDAQQIGFVISFAAIIGVLVNTFLISWITSKFSDDTAITLSMGLLVISFFFYSFAHSFIELMVLLLPLGIGSSVVYTLFNSRMTKAVPESNAGTGIGLSHATRTFCGVIGPPIGGYLLAYVGFQGIGMFGSALSFLALSASYGWQRQRMLSKVAKKDAL